MLLSPLLTLLYCVVASEGFSFKGREIVQQFRDAVRPLTNGQLLAAGMHLQPPKPIAKKIVQSKKRRANAVDTAPLARRSSGPEIPSRVTITGKDATTGEVLGFLDFQPEGQFEDATGFVLTFNIFNPDHFENVFLIDSSKGLNNIDIAIEDDPDFPGTDLVVGAGWEIFFPGDPTGPFTLGKGSSNVAIVVPANKTDGPATLDSQTETRSGDPFFGHGPTESNIWSINPLTFELTASWINPDNSLVPVTIFWDPQEFFGNVGIAGDLDAAVAASDNGGNEGTFPLSNAAIPIKLFVGTDSLSPPPAGK
ncbi:hypothetical protein SISSUDRAFT_1051966 [Sistotremastrum suecicum HHB10207 ss-3]|uniref:Glycoside hydrolase 131 catalytic N-terminal domain-containing protein n=1 Tax=Sistotremastrum suecicum HHB10207 ss-3 TaxID=1314776 RepID=A0A166A6X9_9AGAM|nr:hypothetical protein SISSUDRAFT_1051966 [Sistotremastrum suecicum HHB10207 ss-3]